MTLIFKRNIVARSFNSMLAVAGLALLLLGPLASAQSDAGASASHSGQASTSSPSGSFMSPATASSQNLAAAEEEDETAVYKTSPSVRAIGRLLGLSPRASSAVFEYFNFLILAGVVIFYLAKALPGLFRERQKKIDQQLVEARAATEEANQRLQVVEDRLGRLDQQIEELRRHAEQESAADEVRIKQSIEDERKKVVAAATDEIGAATAAAQTSLRKFAAELAMDRAASRLELTEPQDRLLVHEFGAGLTGADVAGRRN